MSMLFLDLPEEIIKRIGTECCLVKIRRLISPPHNRTTEVLMPRLDIRQVNKLLHRLCTKDVIEAIKNDLMWVRINFFLNSAIYTMRAIQDNLPDDARRTYTLKKGDVSLMINLHSTTQGADNHGNLNRCMLFIDFTMLSTSTEENITQNSHTVLTVLNLPDAYAEDPENRSPEQNIEMQQWFESQKNVMDEKWFKEFERLHRNMRANNVVMFEDMLDESE